MGSRFRAKDGGGDGEDKEEKMCTEIKRNIL